MTETGTWVNPDFEVQNGTPLKTNYDNVAAVAKRFANAFAVHEMTNPIEIATAASDVDIGGDKFDVSGHTLFDDLQVQLTSSEGTPDLPDPLVVATTYWVVGTVAGTSFQLSLTEGGAAIDLLDVGTGTHTIIPFPSMFLEIEAGMVWPGASPTEIARAYTAKLVNATTDPRIDRLGVDPITGAITVITGAEAASPVAPDYIDGLSPLCQVAISTSVTAIDNTLITDERVSSLPADTYVQAADADVTKLAGHTAGLMIFSKDSSNRVLRPGEDFIEIDDANHDWSAFLNPYVPRTVVIDPSAERTIDLFTTNVPMGFRQTFINVSTSFKIVIVASAGATKMSFLNGHVTLMAKQDDPTTPAHWMIVDSSGGARPSFKASTSGNQLNITGIDLMEFGFINHDTNNDYDETTNFRFQPLVPALYHISAHITWIGGTITSNDDVRLYLHLNGSIRATNYKTVTVGANQFTQKISTQDDMNGTSDYFDVRLENADSSASDVLAGAFFQGHIL